MGMPKLDPSKRRYWCHSVNFYRDEDREVSRFALKQGIHIAQFLRLAAKEKMEREKEATP